MDLKRKRSANQSNAIILSFRKPSSGEAGKKPSRPSSAAREKPNDKKKELDARERRRKEMAQNQVDRYSTQKDSESKFLVFNYKLHLHKRQKLQCMWY